MTTAPRKLPPVDSVPVSAEARLTYVLWHFRRAYEDAEALPPIGYYPVGPTDAPIVIGSGHDDFFAGQHPYPPYVSRRPWLGREIPFLFDDESESPLELRPDGTALISADIVSAAFYLLSGWQEYFSAERDQHGRFPFSASVQHRYGFATAPVVNYYFDILRTAVEHVTGQPLRLRRWAGGAPFATFVTHDIDNLYSAWKAPTKAAWQRGDWGELGRRLGQRLTQPDAWNNLAQVQQQVAQYDAPSTFFFIPEHRPAPNGTPNADYRLANITGEMRELERAGAEIQLHGSIGTATDLDRLRHEASVVPRPNFNMPGIRFHYLSWEPRITPRLLDDLAFEYDSTLGFAERFGFRHSYCLPFRLFDFATGKPHNFLEIPLNLMDATLHHPRYLQLAPAEIMPAIEPMLQEIERFGGVFTLLWHNENFDPANQVNGPREFHRIMEYLRSRGTAFLTGRQIVNE